MQTNRRCRRRISALLGLALALGCGPMPHNEPAPPSSTRPPAVDRTRQTTPSEHATLKHAVKDHLSTDKGRGIAVSAAMPTEYVRSLHEEFGSLLSQCYRAELALRPEARGRLDLEITVIGYPRVAGVIESIRPVDDNPLHTAELGRCVENAGQSLLFAAPQQPLETRFVQPLIFRPQ